MEPLHCLSEHFVAAKTIAFLVMVFPKTDFARRSIHGFCSELKGS